MAVAGGGGSGDCRVRRAEREEPGEGGGAGPGARGAWGAELLAMVPISLPDSALGHIPESRSPLTGAFGALVTPLQKGAPLWEVVQRCPLRAALGVLREPPAAGFPGVPPPSPEGTHGTH